MFDKKKHLFEVVVAMKRATFIENVMASSHKQAKSLVVMRIAKKHDVHPATVWGFIKENPNCIIANLIR